MAPMMAPQLSASSASRSHAIVPSGRISPACCVLAISVPAFSSTSTKKMVRTTLATPSEAAPPMSSGRKVGANGDGVCDRALEPGQAEGQAEGSGSQDADQNRSRHATGVQSGDNEKAEAAEERGWRGEMAKAQQCL
jgi:hypothetical protein